MNQIRKIRGWKDLQDLENENFKVDVDLKRGNAHINCKTKWAEDNYPRGYLSTHSFCPNQYKGTEEMLIERGFAVELVHDEDPESIQYVGKN